MDFDIITAITHPSEYMLHKYWARKPHNIVNYYISKLVPRGGLVVDPFCGSGVSLKESQKLGVNAIGFDINPIANLISKVTCSPPDTKKFIDEMDIILDDLEGISNKFFSINGKTIKYLKHQIQTKCNCGEILSKDEVEERGRSYFCNNCGEKLRFNLENLYNTKIMEVVTEKNEIITDSDLINEQLKLSNSNILKIDTSEYNFLFVENRRILSFKNMMTEDLFTERNFSILCYIANRIYKIKDDSVRDAALLLLTGSVAQCSKLIPARNNLSTGGPAWSVPGFWVPAEHLEANPTNHIKARYKKFVKGLKVLNKTKNDSNIDVINTSYDIGLDSLVEKQIHADLIFFDPPYGDSVPYLEFSSIWNSFLKNVPNTDLDISVSDRMPKSDSWDKYYKEMDNSIKKISNVLKDDGKLLITFNNNDMKAWEALISGLQNNSLVCLYVTYQIPAVISSKAQFSPKGSYLSDIYSIYEKQEDFKVTKSLKPISEALIKAASARNGIIYLNFAYRISMIEWMKHNISVELLSNLQTLIDSIFDYDRDILRLKEGLLLSGIDIQEMTRKTASSILEEGPIEWKDLFSKIAQELLEFGMPEPSEIRSYIKDYIIFNKTKAMSTIDKQQRPNFEQLTIEF